MPEKLNDFAELDLPAAILKAIDALGYVSCTPIQSKVLPYALDGYDIIGQAQTGTGKTAAFLITLLTYHLENPEIEPRYPGCPFALIIAPTRELVMQIANDATDLTVHTDIKVVTVVGGIDYEKQKRSCQEQVDVLVATPGRLLDFCRSGYISLASVETLVLDEADRMLSMGFIPDVRAIVRQTRPKDKRQTLLFSATISDEVRRLSDQWTQDPITVEIEPQRLAVDTVEQKVYLVSQAEKYTLLYNLIQSDDVSRVIVFLNRRDETRRLEARLSRDKISCGLLTGEVPQRKRMRTLQDFKSGKIKVLVATDVAGRGIHVDNVSHVINYNLPEDPEDYIHRIGRTGRAGSQGISISFACEADSFELPIIEALLGTPLPCYHPDEALLIPPRSR